MRIDMPLFKIVTRPLVPISGSWVDATPFIILFILLFAASFFLLKQKRCQIARRSIQLLSAFVFIIFLHRCLCAIRGWVFGLHDIGTDTLNAFAALCMIIPIMAFTFSVGRVFCGWACPLGLMLEMFGKLDKLKRKINNEKKQKIVNYLILVAVTISIFWLIWATKPGTQFFVENVAAIWGMALLVILFFVIVNRKDDMKFKKLRYLSLALFLGITALGIFTTTPWCMLFGDEIDYSSMVAFFAVILASAVVAMSWCRYLCPFGSLLAVLSKFSFFKKTKSGGCSNCSQSCEDVCMMNAIKAGKLDQSSCIYCGRCIEHCGFKWQGQDFISPESEGN